MIGNIPDGWKIKIWDDVLEIKNGKNQKAVVSDNGIYPIYGSGGIMGYANDYLCKENAVIIGRKGSINNPLFVKEKFWNVDTAFGLITNENILLPLYLYYFSLTFDFERLNTTTTIPSLTKTRLKNIQIPLPPLPQQEKIVKVLDISSELIEQQKELIAKYDLFLKSKFIEMFGDPILNPMGWEVVKFEEYIDYIGDIGSNGSNAVISKNLNMLDKKDYALMIRTTNLNKNDFKNNVKYVSKETYDFFKKSKIFGGEIIMNKIGSAGKFWKMPYLHKPVSLGLNQLVIRLKNLNTEYLYYLLSTNYGKTLINSKTNGAVTKSITKGAVKDIEIMISSTVLQNKFASIVEKIETIKTKEAQKLEHLETLHKSLMDRAFKGEIE